MTNAEFAARMKEILVKAQDASGVCLNWRLVSDDPDCVADFGCDRDGNLVIQGDSFPLKISEMTNIRYRWNNETDDSDCYFRFDFGKENYLDCCFSDCDMGQWFHIRYNGVYKTCLKQNEAIHLLEELQDNK